MLSVETVEVTLIPSTDVILRTLRAWKPGTACCSFHMYDPETRLGPSPMPLLHHQCSSYLCAGCFTIIVLSTLLQPGNTRLIDT